MNPTFNGDRIDFKNGAPALLQNLQQTKANCILTNKASQQTIDGLCAIKGLIIDVTNLNTNRLPRNIQASLHSHKRHFNGEHLETVENLNLYGQSANLKNLVSMDSLYFTGKKIALNNLRNCGQILTLGTHLEATNLTKISNIIGTNLQYLATPALTQCMILIASSLKKAFLPLLRVSEYTSLNNATQIYAPRLEVSGITEAKMATTFQVAKNFQSGTKLDLPESSRPTRSALSQALLGTFHK